MHNKCNTFGTVFDSFEAFMGLGQSGPAPCPFVLMIVACVLSWSRVKLSLIKLKFRAQPGRCCSQLSINSEG